MNIINSYIVASMYNILRKIQLFINKKTLFFKIHLKERRLKRVISYLQVTALIECWELHLEDTNSKPHWWAANCYCTGIS